MSEGPAAPDASAASGPPCRSPHLLLAALGVLSLLLVGSLLVPGALAGTLFALLGIAFPVGLMALGAVRRGRLDRRVGLALVLLLALLESSAVGILALSGTGPPDAPGRTGSTGPLGLPAATLIELAGLWLLPLPLVALAYAWTFDRSGVRSEDLAALRRRAVPPDRS